MKTSCKYCWGLSILLVAVIATMGYMFVLRGNVIASADGRTAIILSAGERDIVLTEMRGFLEGIQTITEGLVKNDMASISASAKTMGMANALEVPASLLAKLPLEFKTLGFDTHKAFDNLAMEAKDMGDKQIVLAKLSQLMLNCTNCHASYRLGSEGIAKE
jgi:hypothetical protein